MTNKGRNLKVWVEAEVHPSPEELADVFWAMDSEEQAWFFNHLGEISQQGISFQLQAVTDSERLTHHGRFVMSKIGDYSDKRC